MKYIIITLILFANNANAETSRMDCVTMKGIDPRILRCENNEAICYVGARSGQLSCNFKRIL